MVITLFLPATVSDLKSLRDYSEASRFQLVSINHVVRIIRIERSVIKGDTL
jgi:hypothetical protein